MIQQKIKEVQNRIHFVLNGKEPRQKFCARRYYCYISLHSKLQQLQCNKANDQQTFQPIVTTISFNDNFFWHDWTKTSQKLEKRRKPSDFGSKSSSLLKDDELYVDSTKAMGKELNIREPKKPKIHDRATSVRHPSTNTVIDDTPQIKMDSLPNQPPTEPPCSKSLSLFSSSLLHFFFRSPRSWSSLKTLSIMIISSGNCLTCNVTFTHFL